MDMLVDSFDPFTADVPPGIDVLRRVVDGFKGFQALRAACECGLFDWLDRHGPADKSGIATALKLRGAHLGAFLQSLEDLGLLARADGRYVVAPGMAAVLCTSAPWCQAERIAALTAAPSRWADLAAFLSESWSPRDEHQAWPVTLRPFLGESRRVAAWLAARWRAVSPRQLLCFDGAEGLGAAAICRQFPGIDALIVVPTEAVGRAGALINACGLGRRCRVVAGSVMDLEPGAQYERVVLFHSLYAFRKSTADALARSAAHVAPGGEFCAANWFCLEACETAPGGLRDLDKAVLTDSHPLCHIERFGQRLEEAGLVQVERHDLAGEYGNTKVHVATRQAGR
jgi:hypothetical protein